MADDRITGKVLIVDDEQSLCDVLEFALTREGHSVKIAHDGQTAMRLFTGGKFDAVIQDVRLGTENGIELLRQYRETDPDAEVIILTAFPADDNTIQAMRLGAFTFIEKPPDTNNIKTVVSRAILQKRLKAEKNKPDILSLVSDMMVGNSEAIKKVHDLIVRAAASDSTVIVYGESGTGKELVARALHYNSPRVNQPFIAVNCGAFTETLLESELFGHVKGSFTGAIVDKKGLVEVADKGTFFLDEISEISSDFQKKLLRFLEDKEFKPVGSVITRKVDVRFVAATNRDLENEVREKRFREDLFYRLNVIPINIPPLRDRKEDIPLLVGYFLARYARGTKEGVTGVTREAMNLMMNYDWPGNVRELENTVQRALALCNEKNMNTTHLVEKIQICSGESRPQTNIEKEFEEIQARYVSETFRAARSIDLDKKIAEIEKIYIAQALKAANHKLAETAALLGVTSRSLRYKMKKYGLQAHE